MGRVPLIVMGSAEMRDYEAVVFSNLTAKPNIYYNYESLGERPRGFLCFHPISMMPKGGFTMHSFV